MKREKFNKLPASILIAHPPPNPNEWHFSSILADVFRYRNTNTNKHHLRLIMVLVGSVSKVSCFNLFREDVCSEDDGGFSCTIGERQRQVSRSPLSSFWPHAPAGVNQKNISSLQAGRLKAAGSDND